MDRKISVAQGTACTFASSVVLEVGHANRYLAENFWGLEGPVTFFETFFYNSGNNSIGQIWAFPDEQCDRCTPVSPITIYDPIYGGLQPHSFWGEPSSLLAIPPDYNHIDFFGSPRINNNAVGPFRVDSGPFFF